MEALECNRLGDPSVARYPINCVSWNQAAAFCRWQGKRLPTALEWEFAMAGGAEEPEERRFPWGWDLPTSATVNGVGRESDLQRSLMAKYLYDEVDPFPATAPSYSYPLGAGKWGELHLADNVAEWAGDEGRPGFRLVCGGAWETSSAPEEFERTRVVMFPPGVRTRWIGFRCARDAEE